MKFSLSLRIYFIGAITLNDGHWSTMCLSQVLKTFLTCKTVIYQKLKTETQFLIWKLQALLIDSCCDPTEFQQSVQETMKNGPSIPFQPFTMRLFLKNSQASARFFVAQKMLSVEIRLLGWKSNSSATKPLRQCALKAVDSSQFTSLVPLPWAKW